MFKTTCFYTPVERRDVLWYGPVRPSVRPSVRPFVCLSVRPFTIVFERNNLKTASQIDFTKFDVTLIPLRPLTLLI